MKKIVLAVSTAMVASLAATSVHAEVDNRSASAKAQDMYVQPTLRITQTTQVVSPQQAAQAGVRTFRVPAGSGNKTESAVYDHKGQVIQSSGQATQQQRQVQQRQAAARQAPAAQQRRAQPVAPQGKPQIEDYSRQLKK